MRKELIAFLPAIVLPFAAFAANEGVPVYYQTAAAANSNQINYGQYANQGYTKYVGTSGNKQIVGTRVTTYTTERPQAQTYYSYGNYANVSGMTVNGVAMTPDMEPQTSLYAGYSRRFANFEFKTGVNSILKWDDMIFDEVNVGVRHNFSMRNFDMFAFGEYSYGDMSSGGLSMDYDLEPYDWANPSEGIFTISVGNQSGESQHLRLGFGARNIWDVAGWKLSPVFGYEIFKHDLKMSDHLYPNQGIYLPLMTNMGEYVYGDEQGYYYSLPTDVVPPDTWYQVCMGPEDIKVVVQSGATSGSITALGNSLVTTDYTSGMGDVPWGVYGGECVIIGGDGPIKVGGITHIYNTTWSGFFFGLEVEKQMTLADKLRFYFQVSLPKYSSEGIWPNRTDWQQSPSFLDEGSNGAYAYTAEMEYNLRLSQRLQLSIKVDTNKFHVGKIPGKLYVAQYTQFVVDENGQYVLDDNGLPYLETVPAHTEYVSNSLKSANWQSFGLHLGVKFAF